MFSNLTKEEQYLQDAQVVVNYDLAWTPIEPAQRAGRILRFWPSPRSIEVYVFKPIFSFKETIDIVYGHATQGMIRRWDKLS